MGKVCCATVCLIAGLVFVGGFVAPPVRAEGKALVVQIAAETKVATQEVLISTLSEEKENLLKEYLEELKKPNARKAIRAIQKMGQEAVPSLIESINPKEIVQTQQTVEVLGRLRDPRAMLKLHQLLKEKNEWIRSASIFAISKIGGKQSIPCLMQCLEDPSERVCEMVIKSLGKVADDRAIPGLIEMLRHPSQNLAEDAHVALVQISKGTKDYGTDWVSWQRWYESMALFQNVDQ